MKRKEWRCYHCDKVFTERETAREHFGTDFKDMFRPASCVAPESILRDLCGVAGIPYRDMNLDWGKALNDLAVWIDQARRKVEAQQ